MKSSIIKRISAFALCGIVLSGCSKASFNKTEQYVEYPLNSNAVVQEPIKYVNQSNNKEKLKAMKKVLENKYLELYLGVNYDIGVYDKRTNEVFLSNPAFYDYTKEEQGKLLNESKKILFSQVEVEYFNNKQKQFTLSSYPDSFSENKNQVTVETRDNKLIIKYGIGTKYVDTGLIPAFTEESYNLYDKKLIGMRDEKKISTIQYRAFVNNYTKMVYDELSSQDKQTYSEMYPVLKDMKILYILKPGINNKGINDLLEMYSLLGINKEVIKAEEEKIDLVQSTNIPAYFEIPIIYQLQENDLIISLDTKNILASEGYQLTKINLLKSFLNSVPKSDGYMFLPDGSGIIINNNNNGGAMDKLSIPFYGADFAKNYISNLNIEADSNYPVFGMKTDHRAIVAIVENGEAMGGVTGQVKSNYLDYNIVYPYYNYKNYDYLNLQGVAYAFSKKIPTSDYRIRYHFLYEDNANYSGMARYYQKYLEQRGYLQKKNAGNSLPIDINILGSITKTVNKVGIPIETSYPVTTFHNANSIMKDLKGEGVEKANILYSGIINKGMQFKAPSKVSFQKELGGLQGFKELYLNTQNLKYNLFTDVDFTKIYEKGNGVTKKDDVTKYLSKNTSVIAAYDPANNEKNRRNAAYIVNPLLYEEIGEAFIKEYGKANHKELYLSSIGSILSSNFSVTSELTREETKNLTIGLLEKLEEKGYNIKFDSGNQYVLPFASSITNIETSSSDKRIESYSIPFVGMVLKGYIPYTTKALNKAGNYERAVLEAVESGAGLNYVLMHEKQLTLVDTQYRDLFSVNYDLISDRIIETYKKLNKDLGFLANTAIIKHERVKEHISCLTYADASKIYVNYSNEDFYVDNKKVPAMNYLVISK